MTLLNYSWYTREAALFISMMLKHFFPFAAWPLLTLLWESATVSIQQPHVYKKQHQNTKPRARFLNTVNQRKLFCISVISRHPAVEILRVRLHRWTITLRKHGDTAERRKGTGRFDLNRALDLNPELKGHHFTGSWSVWVFIRKHRLARGQKGCVVSSESQQRTARQMKVYR